MPDAIVTGQILYLPLWIVVGLVFFIVVDWGGWSRVFRLPLFVLRVWWEELKERWNRE